MKELIKAVIIVTAIAILAFALRGCDKIDNEIKNENNIIHHAHLICYNHQGEEIVNKDIIYKKSGIEVLDDNLLVFVDVNGSKIIFRGDFLLTQEN